MNLRKLRTQHDFLSLFIAGIAVLLSQFPPLYTLFHAANLEVKTEKIFYLGPNPYSGVAIQKQFSVANVGRDTGRIKDILLFVTDFNDELLFQSRAQYYLLPDRGILSQNKWNQFAQLSIPPGENWSHVISYSGATPAHYFDEFGAIQEAARREEEEWRERMKDEGFDPDGFDEDMPLFKFSDKTIALVKNEISRQVEWFRVGQYKLVQAVVVEDDVEYKSYEFLVKDAHLHRFMKSMDEFAYGLEDAASVTPFAIRYLGESVSDAVRAEVQTYDE